VCNLGSQEHPSKNEQDDSWVSLMPSWRGAAVRNTMPPAASFHSGWQLEQSGRRLGLAPVAAGTLMTLYTVLKQTKSLSE
jgi:hypothetical protein